jgi:CheY-like chemotaxis protein
MDDRVRLLFIDDDELVLAALRRVFAREPYETFFANNARLGLQIVAQKRVDVVVCDHRMPGMTGVEFFEELNQKHRNVLRVMLSGVGAPPPPPPQKPDSPPPAPLDLATKSKLNQARAQVKNAAYNEGQVHRFIEKPWNDAELKIVIADMAAIAKANRPRPR